MRIALVQMAVLLGDVEQNLARMVLWMSRLQRDGKPNLVVFPEMALMGYGAGDLYFTSEETVPRALKRLAKEASIPALVGAPEPDKEGNLYNSVFLLHKGRVRSVQRKVQLVNYRLFDEKRYFRAGVTSKPFVAGGARVGVLVCEDAWFPEPSRALALRGAEVLVCISASPFDRGKPRLWEHLLRARAVDNILPVAFCNQSGCQDGMAFWGGNLMLDEQGRVTRRGPLFEEDVVMAEVDPGARRLARRRDTRLRDVNPEALADVVEAYYRSWLKRGREKRGE
jgi:NAD+ synthase (glutamine-hydrolysing)